MNQNEKFILTEFWSKKLKVDLRSFYRTTYLGPPIFMLLNVLFCIALEKGTALSFWTLYLPITILSTVYCILLPQKAIRRYRNVIERFEFKDGSEMKLTLIDGRITTISKPDVKDGFFIVGNVEKICKTVINNLDKSIYFIIPEFSTHPPNL